ncbi:MAG: ArsR/SmtB family transcription factor [Lachnospiraceae bacterium]|jgi:DNA-binding transcriptional ArsR family regulator
MNHDIHSPRPSAESTKSAADLPSRETCDRIAESFRQLGDGTRLQIFWLICHGETCVSDIGAAVGMSSPAVSHHLRTLRDAGLITGRRRGKEVYYSRSTAPEALLLSHFLDVVLKIDSAASLPPRCENVIRRKE